MNHEELIDMSKRMVKEYFNRFVHSSHVDYISTEVYGRHAPLMQPVDMMVNRNIDIHEVELISDEKNSDGVDIITLMVTGEDYDVYHVLYDSKRNIVSSHISHH